MTGNEGAVTLDLHKQGSRTTNHSVADEQDLAQATNTPFQRVDNDHSNQGKFEDMIISIPMPVDSPFASKNISPERSQATQFRTIDASPTKGKVIKVRKSPNKK